MTAFGVKPTSLTTTGPAPVVMLNVPIFAARSAEAGCAQSRTQRRLRSRNNNEHP